MAVGLCSQEFFTTLLTAVKVVHQDNGTVVAKELSSRLLQHVGVGKRLDVRQFG